MSRARAAYSAASAQRPAQNSTHARPQSARELLGSSRSRHSSYSRSSSSRACFLVRTGARVFTVANVASRTSKVAADGAREVADPRRQILRRLRFAGEPLEHGLHRARLCAQSALAELVGELERPACVVETSLGTRPRESAVDDRLERRASGCLVQGFLEQWDGATLALD